MSSSTHSSLKSPFSNEQSTSGFISTHVSYEICSWFIPLTEAATLGVAYEMPLTDDSDSLMKDRITLDLV